MNGADGKARAGMVFCLGLKPMDQSIDRAVGRVPSLFAKCRKDIVPADRLTRRGGNEGEKVRSLAVNLRLPPTGDLSIQVTGLKVQSEVFAILSLRLVVRCPNGGKSAFDSPDLRFDFS